MRVCLINPYVDISGSVYHEGFTMLPPLGLAYLAAVLIEAGHEVKIIDCISACPLPARERPDGVVRLGIDSDDMMAAVREFGPDVVGISSCYTIHAPQAYEIAARVKSEYSSDAPVILGGAHVSVVPKEALGQPAVDYVAVGEGEGIITDFCDALQRGRTPEDIPGLLSLSDDGSLKGIRERPRIEDLDSIPFPRRDLVPLDPYLARQRLYPGDINNRRIPKTSVMTSRGCPGNCVFCAVRCTWGRKWIGRSPANVVDEIESLVDYYGIREFDFVDDNVSVSKSRLTGICDLIVERGMDITWATPNGIAIWTLDHELLRSMKRAGCYRLTFGFESGDPDTISFIRKRYSVDKARDIVKYANHLGMWTVGTFVLGFPYEDAGNIGNTVDFACSLGLDLAMFYCATPYPGTEMFEVCRELGVDTTTTPHTRGFDTANLTAEEVETLRRGATVRFMNGLKRHPWKPIEKVHSLDDLRFTAKVTAHGLRMVLSRGEGEKLSRYPNYER